MAAEHVMASLLGWRRAARALPLTKRLKVSTVAAPSVDVATTEVTVIVTPRERSSVSLQCWETLLQHTPGARFVYVDVGFPSALANELCLRVRAAGGRYIRFDEWRSPPEVRRSGMAEVLTEYVAFIDNDVLVTEGWLNRLVGTAREYRAGIVGPLYLESGNPPQVHMAGGDVEFRDTAEGRAMIEQHRGRGVPVSRFDDMKPYACTFIEYHCFLARTELMSLPAAFDEQVETLHEHIDLCLTARELGYSVLCDPQARVLYLSDLNYTVADLSLFLERWSEAAAERSLTRFADKWGVSERRGSFAPVRGYLEVHRSAIELIRSSGPLLDLDSGQVLAQSRSEFLEQAVAFGYLETEIVQFASACNLAMHLFNGLYRPCGRPFLNHVIGTGSALLLNRAAPRVVLAGVLHAAYSHTLGRLNGDQVARALGGADAPLERLVRAYTLRSAPEIDLAEDLASLTVEKAAVLLVEAANVSDMRLSGEVAATGRPDPLNPETERRLRDLCEALGAHTMSVLLGRGRRPRSPIPAVGPLTSFRLAPTRSGMAIQPTNRRDFVASSVRQ